MKIDAVLARHPWPWRAIHVLQMDDWVIYDANKQVTMVVCGRHDEGPVILELVEAHVAAAGRESEARKEGKEQ